LPSTIEIYSSPLAAGRLASGGFGDTDYVEPFE